MTTLRPLRVVMAALLLATTGMAAAAPVATLTFTTPAGIVLPTDTIDVFFTLALDTTSVALSTDATGQVTSGLDLLPPNFDPIFGYTSSNINVAFGCNTTFTSSCLSGPPYDFDFFLGPSSLHIPLNLSIAPGASQSFLFGTFTPTGGNPVAPGTYIFPYAHIAISASGLEIDPITGDPVFQVDANGDLVLDLNGDPIQNAVSTFFFIATCPPLQELACPTAFSRTVADALQVPEPASLGLLVLGLAALRFSRRKKA